MNSTYFEQSLGETLERELIERVLHTPRKRKLLTEAEVEREFSEIEFSYRLSSNYRYGTN